MDLIVSQKFFHTPQMFTENNPLIINCQLAVLESQYTLDVQNLYMDEDAIRINYRITPPVPYKSPETGSALLFTWRGYAVDNLGTQYESWGGACGLSADGEFTEGVLSFIPLLEKNVLFLDVTFIPERINSTNEYNFRVTTKS